MPVAKRWTVDLYLTEHSGEQTSVTHAEARLHTQDKTDLRGHGEARRHPGDVDVPEIGDELAAARALSDLAHQLLHSAADDIEGVTHRAVSALRE